MTNSFKDQLTTDFEKAKNAGSVRVERIRQIFQDAMAQTMTELKEGTGEVRSIAKESTTTLTDNLKQTQKPAAQEVVPVQVEIQDDGIESTVAVVESELAEPLVIDAASTEVHISTDAVQPQADQQAASQSPTSESLVDSLKALIEQALRSFQEGETYAVLQQQFVKLKEQLAVLDTKLSNRFGERYENTKQEFSQDMEKTKAWYEEMKENANTTGTNLLEDKQAELVIKMGEAGATIAQKEAKIKQLLKEMWQTVSKF